MSVTCKKCKTYYSDKISDKCLRCGTELPPEKDSIKDDTDLSSIFGQLRDETKRLK